MDKINNRKLNISFFSLGILAILTFGVITIPTIASADRAGRVTPYNSTDFARVSANDEKYNSYVGPNVMNYSATPVVYSGSPASKGTVAGASTTTVKKSTAIATKPAENASDLAATAIFGSNSFMPSGLVQWILFAILILLVVILVRRITGGEDRYHKEPLKHA